MSRRSRSRNDGQRPASAQLIRVEGDQSRQEVARIYATASEGDPIPDWFRAEAGPGSTAPGRALTVTQELEEGTYYPVNDEGDDPDIGSAFEVTGEASDAELPETQATVTAEEYSFEASGLEQGDNQILFENVGSEPHHVLALPLLPGRTIEDAKRFAKTEQGRPPVDFEKGAFSTVIDGGKSMVIDVARQRGDYALVCFISDRAGGPTHAEEGMVSEATVE